MARYRLTSTAASDVQSIYVQGEDLFGAGQAQTYHAGLQQAFQKLADAPLQTRRRTEYEPPVHIFTFKAHVIVYEPNIEGGIVILRVRHAHEGLDDVASLSPAELSLAPPYCTAPAAPRPGPRRRAHSG